jgi:hypothetical protein
MNPTSENVGYEYRDVIVAAKAPSSDSFPYQAVNVKNKYKILKAAPVTATFTLFDWKWLSNYKIVSINVTDA